MQLFYESIIKVIIIFIQKLDHLLIIKILSPMLLQIIMMFTQIIQINHLIFIINFKYYIVIIKIYCSINLIIYYPGLKIIDSSGNP